MHILVQFPNFTKNKTLKKLLVSKLNFKAAEERNTILFDTYNFQFF